MSKTDDFQLPAGIQMPECFTQRLSFQIWFYSGVQTGLAGRAPQNEIELRKRSGTGVAAAYQAGLEAGRIKRAEVETPAHQIPVPEQYRRTLQGKLWFLKGVDDALAGQGLEHPLSMPHRRDAELLRAYKAGFQAGKRAGG
jgi:hypothetical protein